ncbi:unnamed protein product [Hydatigera taeniaeformis]|uniref:Zinc finger protein n=1 Tax=Hydatigena taeniaeformis TaxID=6205 RepID=A0A0R3WLY4_HYDTA|nr:unnamed protein product [Hydatigera taeniaeformis]
MSQAVLTLLLLLTIYNHLSFVTSRRKRPFKCPCGRSYIRRQHLTRHANTCPGTPTTLRESKGPLKKSHDSVEYSCPKCTLGHFSKKKSVWAHMAIVHGDRRFKCGQCDAAFTTNSKLERHQKRHHNLRCHICENILAGIKLSEGVNDSVSASSSGVLTDRIERFENFIELRKHISKQHSSQKFICKICHRHFSRRAHLLEHELSHTPMEERRKFLCTDCSSLLPTPVAFTSKRGLVAHTRTVHSSEVRRFPCTYSSCPAILSTKQKLKGHLQLHTRGSGSEVVRVIQRSSLLQRRRNNALMALSLTSLTKDGTQLQRPKRRKCVPLRDLQERWETESQSSVVALLR